MALVEDHADTREALVRTLERFRARVELVAAFPDAMKFLDALPGLDISVALIDLGLPRLGGSELIERLATCAPPTRAIALTVLDDKKNVMDAICAGAYGYLLKDEPKERIVLSIEEAALGMHPISSRVAGFLMARTRQSLGHISISDREEELARALASGLSYAECAEQMQVALGTVQEYVKRLYRKLDVTSRKEVRAWVEARERDR